MGRRIIVCLANSRKNSERCVAGRELVNGSWGPWIRPVNQNSSISDAECRYQNGTQVAVGDIVSIGFQGSPATLGENTHQTENQLIDGTPWTKLGTITSPQLLQIVEHPQSLWADGHSKFHGVNDHVPVASLSGISDSLKLIHPSQTTLEVYQDAYKTHLSVRASFQIGLNKYKLMVTHPEVEQQYAKAGVGSYPVNAVLCVSLGEVFKGVEAYKLVAAVIEV